MKVTTRWLVLIAAVFLFAGTTSAVVPPFLFTEDFSGTPGDDLSTKGWIESDQIDLSGTVIDVGNSGQRVHDGYAKNSNLYSLSLIDPLDLAPGQQYIVEHYVEFVEPIANNNWFRLGLANPAGDGPVIWLGREGPSPTNTHIKFDGGADFASQGTAVVINQGELIGLRVVQTKFGVGSDVTEGFYNVNGGSFISMGTATGTINSIDHAYYDGENYSLTNVDSWRLELTADPSSQGDGTWINDGTGLWIDSANWDLFNAPTTSRHSVTFADAISAPTTVAVDTDVTINAITFDHSISYGVGGVGSLNLAANTEGAPILPVVSVVQGDHQILVATNLTSDTTVNVASGSTLSFHQPLNLMGNTLTKMGAGAMSINNVLITGEGRLNLQEGTISGVGTVGGSLVNTGGMISPGDPPQNSTIPEPCGIVLFVLCLLVLLGARHREQ